MKKNPKKQKDQKNPKNAENLDFAENSNFSRGSAEVNSQENVRDEALFR